MNDLLKKWNTIMDDFKAQIEANKQFEEFKTAIESNDNKKIETTRVFGYLNKIVENDKNFIKTIQKGSDFYRARKGDFPKHFGEEYGISIGEDFFISGLSDYEMKAPPLGLSNAGRNNIAGVSYLYLSGNPYTACCEIRPNYAECICIATFRLNRDICVVDFKENDSVRGIENGNGTLVVKKVITQIMRTLAMPNNNPNSIIYRISQFVSEFFRKNGYDGIRYMSLRGDDANLTLFNHAEKYISIINKDWVQSNRMKYKFDYLNQGKESLETSKDFDVVKDENKFEIRKNLGCSIKNYRQKKQK